MSIFPAIHKVISVSGRIIKIFVFVFVLYSVILFGSESASAATYNIDILPDGSFNPDTQTINTGDTVTWTNTGTTEDANSISGDNHTQHLLYPDPQCDSDDTNNTIGCWDAKPHPMDGGEVYSFTFWIGGTWNFHNHTNKPGPNDGILTITDLNVPATTTDLAASNPAGASVDLAWTSPGDDVGNTGNFGAPTSYDVRYSIALITEANWSSATQATGEPTPQVAGASESMTVTGLSDGTNYYFALKTTDDNGNVSGLSNVPSETTTGAIAVSILSSGDFSPATININSGDSVKWTMTATGSAQPASDVHADHFDYQDPVCPNPGCFESPSLGLNDTYIFTFQIPGSWEYHNHITPGKKGTVNVSDTNSPDTTSDFSASNPTNTSVDLSWTSPGDDAGSTANFGTPTTYDVRYSSSLINEGNWASATQVTAGEPTPQAAGASETMTVSSLNPGITYYFGLKTTDDSSNESSLSNIPSLATTGASTPPSSGANTKDFIFPEVISDLSATAIDEKTVELIWSAPGDDGLEGTTLFYDARYNTEEITIDTWTASTQTINEPLPKLSGVSQSMRISDLSPSTTYYFAINSTDDGGNEAKFSNVASATTLPPPDITAPSSILDLTRATPTLTSVDLSWTAPGDDGNSGTATSYDIKYSTISISEKNWASSISFVNIPPPMEAGSSENLTIPGFIHEKTYYIAIKTLDEEGNESGISNVITFTIPPLLEKSVATVTSQDGGHITAAISEGVILGIDIPPGAVLEDSTFTVSPIEVASEEVAYEISKTPSMKNIFGSHFFDAKAEIPGAAIITLSADIKLTFTYTPIRFNNLRGKIPEIHYYDRASEIWIPLTETTKDSEANTLTAFIDRVALFAVFTEEDTTPPTPPTLIRTKALGDGKIQITWTNPTEDFAYIKIYRSEILGELGKIRAPRIFSREFIDIGVLDGVTYFYTVRAVDAAENESENEKQVGAYAVGTSFDQLIPPRKDYLIRGPDGIKVYIINDIGYKRHIFNPAIFDMYGHFSWEDVRDVSKEALDSYVTSDLYRADGDSKVFALEEIDEEGGIAIKRHIEMTSEQFTARGYDWNQVFVVNATERDYYETGSPIK